MANWPAGTYYAQWYNPTNGLISGTSQAKTTNGQLSLPLPDYTVDLAGIVYPQPSLAISRTNPIGALQLQLNSEVGGIYTIQLSTNLANWISFLTVTNTQGIVAIPIPPQLTNASVFYRATR
jgi:hypothetical protein